MNILLVNNFNIFEGAQMNRLIETVVLSTHNICFGSEIRKKIMFSACIAKASLYKRAAGKSLRFEHTQYEN